MSRFQANCPNCGATVAFRWSSAVQTTCEYCRSVLVRHDVDLRRVGQVADLPIDISPIQIGTEGQFGGVGFQVLGRIIYRYELGSWNEWHCVYSDGRSGWLSDAQCEYAVSFLSQPTAPLPPAGQLLRPGFQMTQHNVLLTLTVLTEAEYAGVEGELPFVYYDKTRSYFADFRTPDGRFATLDYTEGAPLLFLGQFVPFADLKLKNLKEFEGWSQ